MREEIKIKREFIKNSISKGYPCYYYNMKINYYLNDNYVNFDNIICRAHDVYFGNKIKIHRNDNGDYLYQEEPQGCPMCKETKEKFIKRSKIYHGDKYDYSKIKIDNRIGTDNKSRIFIDDIICPEDDHDKFSTRSDSWKMGCPKCVGRNLTDYDIIEKVKKMYGDRYNYRFSYIKEEDTRIDGKTIKNIHNVYCNVHYDYFNIPVKSHLRGAGCPVCAESSGEAQTARVLDSLKIEYVRQKTFDDLRHKKKLRFDFYIPSLHRLIEYDGDQHIKAVSIWGGEESFINTQLKDKLKNEYCITNNIPLLRLNPRDNTISIKSKILYFLQIKESMIINFSNFII